MRFAANTVLLSLCATLIVACSAQGPTIEEKLDRGTGATVRRAIEPLVLYRDDSAYAAHARNYVYVGPVEINRMGTYSYYLWFGIWNTIRDDQRAAGVRDGFETAVLFLDGAPLPLELAGWTLDAIGVSEPVYVKPVAGAADAYYRVTLDQVRMIAEARDIELHVGNLASGTYMPWDGPHATVESFRPFARYQR